MTDVAVAPPAPKPFPLPGDFPVTWPDPAMAMAPWQQDRMHMPDPATPMSSWLSQHFSKGFSGGLASYSLPLACSTARINSYFYMAIAPNVPPEQMPELEAKAEPLLKAGIATFWPRWQEEWLPEIKQFWYDWSKVNLQTLDDAGLVEATNQLITIYERCWHIHFEMLLPALVGISEFQEVYGSLFPDAGPLDAYRLLRGSDSMSLEAGRKLWALSRSARANADVLDALEEETTAGVIARLEATEAGRQFLAQFNDYIAFYGRRSDGVQELAQVSWTEDPTPALTNLKTYVLQDEDQDPDIAHAKLAEERDALLAQVREAIANHPEEVRGAFEGLLAAATFGQRVQEDHNFWIDQRTLHEVRQLCREYGRRMVERGAMDVDQDIFCLTMHEAQDYLASGVDARPLVADRKAEMAHWAKITPPPMVGMDYGPPPDNPITRAIGRFWGAPNEPAEAKATELRGNSGSAGVVRGTARIVMTIHESDRLGEGEILVTPTTAPPWTPLFAYAGGIVTETGGALSHCAIVAREYGIPAVVGATNATGVIQDGMTIEVDGDKGIVRILS